MKNKIELSVVLPVFNEEKNIPLLANKYLTLSKKNNIEVLFVEDTGSSDNTRTVIRKYEKRYTFIRGIFTNKRGYGASIYDGLKKSKGEFICWTHADLQTDPKDTITALNLAKKSQDPKKVFIKGNRYGRSLFDSFFTLGMSMFETVYLGKKLYDINAQPNLFHHSFLKKFNDPPKDFSFDLYGYYTALNNGYDIIKFPVFFGKRKHGHSKWNTGIKSKIKFIQRTIKFSKELKKRLKITSRK